MAGYNRVIMMGNLTRDPEYKQLASGQAVCRLGLAANRQFKNRQTGELQQEVCFVDIDVWGPQAESTSKYLQKGRAVLVEGRLKLDTWEEADGTKRSKHSIVADRVTFLSTQASDDSSDFSYSTDSSSSQETPKKQMKAATQQTQTSPKPASSKSSDYEYERDDEGTSSGEVTFKDEKPFEDDLPF